MKARLLTAICVTAAIAVVEGQSEVPYPTGYRDWSHIKSMVIEEGHPLFEAFGGIHHIYANDEAVTGYQDGRFPDGAVIAFDLLEAVRADNAVTEGARKVLGVMHKDSERYPATGGWASRDSEVVTPAIGWWVRMPQPPAFPATSHKKLRTMSLANCEIDVAR